MTEIPLKRCSKGDECVHPMGCFQPATAEHFRKVTDMIDGFRSACKECEFFRNDSRRSGITREQFMQRRSFNLAARLEADNLFSQGLKLCSHQSGCAHPLGPLLPASSDYFRPQKDALHGLKSNCRKCDTVLARLRRSRLRSNPVSGEYQHLLKVQRENTSRYNERHPEKVRERSRMSAV